MNLITQSDIFFKISLYSPNVNIQIVGTKDFVLYRTPLYILMLMTMFFTFISKHEWGIKFVSFYYALNIISFNNQRYNNSFLLWY